MIVKNQKVGRHTDCGEYINISSFFPACEHVHYKITNDNIYISDNQNDNIETKKVRLRKHANQYKLFSRELIGLEKVNVIYDNHFDLSLFKN